MGQKAREQLGFRKTAGAARRDRDRLGGGLPGRPRLLLGSGARPLVTLPGAATSEAATDESAIVARGQHQVEPLVREWLLDLQAAGRSPKTIRWYEQKIRAALLPSC